MFLRVKTNDKRWDVDDLLSNPTRKHISTSSRFLRNLDSPNVTLSDERTRVVNTLGKVGLEYLRLQPAFQEIFDFQCQYVIETHASLIEHTNTDETTDECVTLEKTLGVLVIELEQLTSSTTDFGEDETDTPDLAFVAEAVLAGELDRCERQSG